MLIGQFNVRSLVPKFNDLKEHILATGYHILCLSETHLSPRISNEMISIQGYKLVRNDRRYRVGGGVCVYIKNSIKYSVIPLQTNIEQLWIKLCINTQVFIVGAIYRPPNFPYVQFLDLFEQSVAFLLPTCDELFCLGDFNIDMLNINSAYNKFQSMLESYSLSQVVDLPTRITLTSSTIIDLILTTNVDIIKEVNVISLGHQISDHELTSFQLNIELKDEIKQPIFKTIRDFKHFNNEQFSLDLKLAPLEIMYEMTTINDKLLFLNNTLLDIFNNHAPVKNIKITKNYAPWITDNVKLLMSLRDKAKLRWRRSKQGEHYDYYKQLRNYTTLACKNEKKAYYEHRLRSSGVNGIWKDLELLNIRKKEKIIPENLNDVEKLNYYYINSIPNLPVNQNIINYYQNNVKDNIGDFNFRIVSENEVQKILYSIKTNSQGSDGLNIKMLLLCCPYILPYITHIVNFCLQNSVFPDSWKVGIIQPIPKCNNPEELKDLRPITILPTLSKVVERVVDQQLREHLSENKILPNVQSGFRAMHSCETALLHITDDILRGVDNKKITVLVLIDFSKAFDTINHQILLAILHYIGLNEKCINFFHNYLENRIQRVKIGDSISTPLLVSKGVPQGSILAPTLYTLYTSDFIKVIKKCSTHFYADDTQLYYSFPLSDSVESINVINKDLASLVDISKDHALNINANKTVVLVFGPQKDRTIISSNMQITVDGQQISPSDKARNLGLTYDTCLRFKPHISNCIRLAYYNLKMIYNSRYFLSQKVKKILCESLVLSKFNFSDFVYGSSIDAVDSRRIQTVQNSCLRLIFGIRKHQHITHKLSEINWLNMYNRRQLHAACLCHKIILYKSPMYLYEKLSFRTDVHNLNIRSKGTLTPPLHHTELFKRSFSYQITKIYNEIPQFFKTKNFLQFKHLLKCKMLVDQNVPH